MINYDFLFEDKKDDYQKILKELRAANAQLIDIRESSEWEQHHFKCAIHIPLSDLAKGKGIETLKEIKRDNKKMRRDMLQCPVQVVVEIAGRVKIVQRWSSGSFMGPPGCADSGGCGRLRPAR